MSGIEYGVQLYTLRKYGKTPAAVAKMFEKVGKMGVSAVQVSGLCEMDAQALRTIADDNGLKIICTHSPFKRMVEDLDRLCEEHLILGAQTLGLGMMPSEYSKDGFLRLPELIEIANRVSETASGYGLRFAYHNHWHEFKLHEGARVIDQMAAEIPSMDFILDTCWVDYAGASNTEYAAKFAGRIPIIHVKDYKKLGKVPRFRPVGSGVIDFPAVMPAFAAAGTRYALIEQDFARKPYQAVEKSLHYIRANLAGEPEKQVF